MTQQLPDSTATHGTIVDDLDALLNALPPRVQTPLRQHDDLGELLEVVLDLGRAPEARFRVGDVRLDDREVTEEDLQYVVARTGDFGDDNRAGIERTLHRISCIRNRRGKIVGLTCRVGRAVYGTIRILEDLVFSGRSVLLLGRPGVGKTTMLREVARVLSTDARKRVIVVDTSNEIGGDGDIPHPAIGRARRMQVPTPDLQHAVMIEAVENHMPEVIIIDEMGTELEAAAARTIAERGVQLVATAHGNTLENLVMNPTLSDLVGGIQAVTLGDEEARRRGTQKTVLERKSPPTFDIVVEIQSWEKVAVHEDVASTVDAWLRGYPIAPEVRSLDEAGRVQRTREMAPASTRAATAGGNGTAPPVARGRYGRRRQEEPEPPVPYAVEAAPPGPIRPTRVFVFGVGREKVEEAGRYLGLPVEVVNDLRSADVLLTTKSQYRRASQVSRVAEEAGKPVYVLRKNTPTQVQQLLRTLVQQQAVGAESMEAALQEAQSAAERISSGRERSVDLSPQRAYVRRLQHLIAERHNLASTSMGREPQRHVVIYRP